MDIEKRVMLFENNIDYLSVVIFYYNDCVIFQMIVMHFELVLRCMKYMSTVLLYEVCCD